MKENETEKTAETEELSSKMVRRDFLKKLKYAPPALVAITLMSPAKSLEPVGSEIP